MICYKCGRETDTAIRGERGDACWPTCDRPQGVPVGDPVNAPAHYTDGGVETIDFIKAKLTDEQFLGYCLGNAMKYVSRAGKKTADPTQDLRKAVWYLKRLTGDE